MFFCSWGIWWSFFSRWLTDPTHGLGMSSAEQGQIYSINSLATLVIMFVYGTIQDQLGIKRKLVIFISAVAACVGPFVQFVYQPMLTAGGTTPSAALATDVASEDERFISDSPRFVKGFMLLLLAVGIGNQVSVWLTALTGLTFPAYIGAMLVAVVVRNVMDGVHVSYPAEEIDTMGNMFLSIFLAMALAGLKLWELIDLAMPMVICLVLQCVVMFLFSYFVVFNVMGRNYDAAVMTAGFIGFGMGATSNAMANMQAVSRRYGPSPSAYFVIPMVGGLFNDFFNAAIIAFCIGLLV